MSEPRTVLGRKDLEKDGAVKLDLGAGPYPRGQDFTTVDYYAAADVKALLWDLPVESGCVDELWSSHALEHVPRGRIHETLKEWLRVLKPGGIATIQVPNFDHVARTWLTGPDRQWAEAMVYGQQHHDGEFHKTAFSPASFRADLEAAGWAVDRIEFRWTHSQETLQGACHKPGPGEGAGP